MTDTATPSAPTEVGVYTADEVSESLTGYDEIGIVQAFGSLTGLDGNMPARALAFVLFKRDGLNHDDAKTAAMSMRARALADVFADDPDDPMPDEPDSEVGKDDSAPSEPPTS